MLIVNILQATVAILFLQICSKFGSIFWIIGALGFSLGYYICHCLVMKSTKFWDFSKVIKSYLQLELNNVTKSNSTIIECASEESVKQTHKQQQQQQNFVNTKQKHKPWDNLLVPQIVDDLIQELFELVLGEHVHSWYLNELSSDHSFLLEIRYHLRYLVSGIWRAVRPQDLTHIIVHKLIPAIVNHAHLYITCSREFRNKEMTKEEREIKILEAFRRNNSLHYALYTRDCELNYLRAAVAFILDKYADHDRIVGNSIKQINGDKVHEWPDAVFTFVHELLAVNLALPLCDLTAQPQIIYKLLILLLDDEPMLIYDEAPSELVPLLRNLCLSSPSQAPDSLLQEKLTDIMKDQKLLYIFSKFVRETRGPLNLFQFVLEAKPLLDQLRDWMNAFSQKSEDSLDSLLLHKKEEDGQDLAYKSWGLFQTYIHDSAHDCIEYWDFMQQFKDAFEMVDLSEKLGCIDCVLDSAYSRAYRTLQFEHVVPFCQSAYYFKMLSGDRPPPPIIVQQTVLDVPQNLNLAKGFRIGINRIFSGRYAENDNVELACESIEDVQNDDFECVDVSDSLAGLNGTSLALIDDVDDDLFDDMQSLHQVDLMHTQPHFDRNINTWTVSIPNIQPTRDSDKGTMYVYMIDVKPPDAVGWSIERQFSEFYVLESKLVQFHGPTIVSKYPLPHKKVMVAKSRVFIESHRVDLEKFLLCLASNPKLERSELLYTFLTISPEFTSAWTPNAFNPWTHMKRMPAKLSRERGQNLEKYFNKLCKSIDEDSASTQTTRGKTKSWDSRSESAISVQSVQSTTSQDRKAMHALLYKGTYYNNCSIQPIANVGCARHECIYGRSLFDVLLFVLCAIVKCSRLVVVCAVSLRIFLRDTMDSLVNWFLRDKLEQALNERRICELIELIRDELFFNEPNEMTDIETRKLRTELDGDLMKLLNLIPDSVCATLGGKDKLHELQQIVMEAIQMPRLNKQLFYTLFDDLFYTVFKDI